MTPSRTKPAGDRIVEPMIALACCSKQHRIVVAGSKGVELTLELHRGGHIRASPTANCGHPAGQYDVALVDWRRRTFKTLEAALDWQGGVFCPAAGVGGWGSGLILKRPWLTKPFASHWKGADLSLRPVRSMNAAAPFRRGDAK